MSAPFESTAVTLWRWAWARVKNLHPRRPESPIVKSDECPADGPAEAAFRDAFMAEWARGAEAMWAAAEAACSWCRGPQPDEGGVAASEDGFHVLTWPDGGRSSTPCFAAPIVSLPLPTPDGRRYRVQIRELRPCTVCGHDAEQLSTVDWSCGPFCCCTHKHGGCKVGEVGA